MMMQKTRESFAPKPRTRMAGGAAALALAALLAGCGQAPAQSAAQAPEPAPAAVQRSAAAETADPAPDTGPDTVGDGTFLLTVDGYGVTEAEYRMFLRDQKAATAHYYWVNYRMQPDGDFWATEVDGQTPLEYAKQRALDEVVRARTEFLLAGEYRILDYKDYDAMMADMEAENAERAAKKQSGEAFYGVERFTPFTYYQYLSGNARAELEHAWADLAAPDDEELRAVYEAYRANLHLGVVYTYEVRYADGTREEIARNTNEIGKADTVAEDLIYGYFTAMQPGDTVEGYPYYDRQADITLRAVEDLGCQSFEEAKDSLKVFYAREALRAKIASRAQAAQVTLDQPRFDALEMP